MNPPRRAPRWVIEPLSEDHDRAAFTSGVVALEDYFHHRVGQDVRRRVTCCYVLVAQQTPRTVLGFYTLSSAIIPLRDFPPEIARRLPRYPNVPATLLGRLAISFAHRGKGLGEHLLIDALTVSFRQSQKVASAAVVVDPKDNTARAFYRRYGFIPLPDTPNRLFLPMKTIARLIRGNHPCP